MKERETRRRVRLLLNARLAALSVVVRGVIKYLMSKIVTAPSEVLRKVAKPVSTLDRRVLDVIKTMDKTLRAAKKPQGVGLAAPQIGESLRIFMIRPETDGPITTFINPEIVKFSQKLIDPHGKKGVYEGCLSIPQHYAPITRSASVTVKYFTLPENSKHEALNPKQVSNLEFSISDLTEKTESFSAFAAHVIQHEMDHLNGILFIDRVLEQNTKLYKIEGEEWYEVGI